MRPELVSDHSHPSTVEGKCGRVCPGLVLKCERNDFASDCLPEGCASQKCNDVLEVVTATVITSLLMQRVYTFETSVRFYQTTQQTAIFTLAAVRTCSQAGRTERVLMLMLV
jgi:hypothetical protein